MLIFVEQPLVPFLLNIKMCFLWGGFSDDYLLCRKRGGRLSRLSDNRCARMKEEAGRVLSGAFIYRTRALFLIQARRSVCQPLTRRAHAHSLVPMLPGDCPAVSDRDQNSFGEMEIQEEHCGLKGFLFSDVHHRTSFLGLSPAVNPGLREKRCFMQSSARKL